MPTSSGRRKSGRRRAASGTRKRKRATAVRVLHGLGLVWDLLPFLLLVAFALTVFVLDPAAVARLAWSSATGAFGPFVQVAVSAVLLGGGGLMAWAFWPEATEAPARRKSGGATKGRTSRAKPDAAGEAAKPRTRKPRTPDRDSEDPAVPAESGAVPAAAQGETVAAAEAEQAAAAVTKITRATSRGSAANRKAGRARQAGATLAGADGGAG
jgi:hypothetical protein